MLIKDPAGKKADKPFPLNRLTSVVAGAWTADHVKHKADARRSFAFTYTDIANNNKMISIEMDDLSDYTSWFKILVQILHFFKSKGS